jgi:hypothetical protein
MTRAVNIGDREPSINQHTEASLVMLWWEVIISDLFNDWLVNGAL